MNRRVWGFLAAGLLGWSDAAAAPAEADDRGGYFENRQWVTEVEANGLRHRVRARLVILNARGDKFAGVAVSGDQFNQIEDFRASVYRADGKKVYERKLKDMFRTCGFGPSYALYSSNCTYSLDLPGPAYPYTIEYEYAVRSKSLFFLRGAAMQSYLPVVRALCQVTAPSEPPLHYKVYGLAITPRVVRTGEKTLYEFAAGNLAPLPNESQLPPEAEYPGRVAFSPHAFRLENSAYSGFSWREVGNWYRTLAADRYLAWKAGVTAGDVRQMAREAYERVTGNTRYVAVSIGIGGWQPHAAAETQKLGYGDCKDMTTLLVSYLRQAGVAAYPALISTRGATPIDPDFPTFDFNHVITAALIDGDTLWMDPTCDLCPFGQLPLGDQGMPVLLVTDSGGVLVRTPAAKAEDNVWARRTHLAIGADYRVNLSAEWELCGVPALWLEAMFTASDSEDRRLMVGQLLTGDNGGYRVTEASLTRRPADSGGGVAVRVAAVSERPVDLVKGTAYVQPAVYRDFAEVRALDFATRRYPVDLEVPQLMTDEVTVTWPSMGTATAEGPGADSIACGHGFWRRTAAAADSAAVRLTMEAACLGSVVEVGELPTFAEYLKKRQAREREPIRLTASGAAGR
ncbi:MAG TPA: DUF3857 domain-containing protein [candidate division Zixibacteria bacterium]|mgnify:CR=1 FL=1|nr:DUF3857 domain-containing transglutaminase family protein [candidate division Zixibacteria bacterium]MDD4916189.1 DUF3857 domain-containing protein [candidate division Zixibacteria bacterium]MDM7972356.1 DUF3857 domain-containing protein [candidate division Zixibacteria bacterium]HOD67074.1 DUF3857 domain-containing protein [candidate division Zixibacteria bacterium]HOZ08523.1 DUF3857 domain-containing protein [candidate division Zixibacteria bacterium]